jgi:hypothetical protein
MRDFLTTDYADDTDFFTTKFTKDTKICFKASLRDIKFKAESLLEVNLEPDLHFEYLTGCAVLP